MGSSSGKDELSPWKLPRKEEFSDKSATENEKDR
jgi:hypothetical protein